MATKPAIPIDTPQTQNCAALSEECRSAALKMWNQRYPGLVGEEELRRHIGRLLDELVIVFAEHLAGTPASAGKDGPLAATARKFSARRADAGFKPAATALYALAIKNILIGRMVSELSPSPAEVVATLAAVDEAIERLPLLTFGDSDEARKGIIAGQRGRPMEDQSTAVIRLWDCALMLPLLGVIDAPDARQGAERLRDAITLYTATVAIIDISGVPLFDARVARHVVKTVDAARSLGVRVVLAGVTTEVARVLTAFGAGFADVIRCATLRLAIREAAQMTASAAPLAMTE